MNAENALIEFESHIGKLDYLLGVHYIFIPEKIVQTMGGLPTGRWICDPGSGIEFQCGLVSLGEGNAYITLNKSRLKKLNLKAGDSIHVKLKRDESEFGMAMSEELKTLLEQDTEAGDRFMKLKPGMQRYIIYYVSQVKNSQLRINRSLTLINNLKMLPEGRETFRAILGKT